MKKVFVILLIISGAYVLFFQSNVFSSWGFGKQETEANIGNKIVAIEIDVSDASTSIIPVNSNILRAELDGNGKVTVEENGDTIKVQFKRKWFEGLPFFGKSKLNIYIPEDYKQDLAIEIGSGNVNYSGDSMQLNELSLDVSSGNVDLEDLTVNTLHQDVSSGNVQLDSLVAKKGSLDLSSGNIGIKNYKGQLEAEVSSGNLDIQMDEIVGPIEIEINSGKASLDLPKDADFTLNGEINSGNIRTNYSLEDKVQDKHQIKGTHGTGKHNIELSVSSGLIEIL